MKLTAKQVADLAEYVETIDFRAKVKKGNILRNLKAIEIRLDRPMLYRLASTNVNGGLLSVDVELHELLTTNLMGKGKFRFHFSRSDREDVGFEIDMATNEDAIRLMRDLAKAMA